MAPVTAIPSVEDELERKAMDELTRILHNYETGRITHREMNLQLDTLWACVSGLAGEDWREMIEEARKVADQYHPWNMVLCSHKTGIVVRAWRDEECLQFLFVKPDGTIARRINNAYTEEEQPSRHVTKRYAALIEHLSDKGFVAL